MIWFYLIYWFHLLKKNVLIVGRQVKPHKIPLTIKTNIYWIAMSIILNISCCNSCMDLYMPHALLWDCAKLCIAQPHSSTIVILNHRFYLIWFDSSISNTDHATRINQFSLVFQVMDMHVLLCLSTAVIMVVAENTYQNRPLRYGVLLDAGSSGTKIKVYRWPQRRSSKEIADINLIESMKYRPNIGSFVHHLQDISNYLVSMINIAEEIVPTNLHRNTPIYLMATAGQYFNTSRFYLVSHLSHILFNLPWQ